MRPGTSALATALAAAAAACTGNVWSGDGGIGGHDARTDPDMREATAAACRDGFDNDGDGWVDCIDVQCTPFCADGGPIDSGWQSDADDGFEECAAESMVAETRLRQPNIIFAVDSSNSMRYEADRVQENINGLADAIIDSDADPRVVMIAERSYVVVPPPLGVDAEHFLHIDNWVGSHNALGRFLGEHANYSAFIHSDGVTHFVVVTDDDSETDPVSWRRDMEAALGDSFVFHSIASPTPVCPGAARPGQTYNQLASETRGAQVSICTDDWTAGFDDIRLVVSESTFLPCSFAIPDPPEGQSLNFMEVNVVYTPGGGSPQTLPYTGTASRCSGAGWHYDDESVPTEIRLCPATCEAVGADAGADISFALGCETQLM